VVAAAAARPEAGALRTELRATLPEYMVPAAFVVLEAFPLTPAGKVDRRRLPAPDLETAAAEQVAPRDDVEHALAGIFREVLRLERIGVHDAFFQIGGNSLLAIQVLSRVRDLFKVEPGVPAFFENASVAGLATVLRTDAATAAQVEKVARARARLAALSPEEKQRLLAQKRAVAVAG
jgi:hypothetical protein